MPVSTKSEININIVLSAIFVVGENTVEHLISHELLFIILLILTSLLRLFWMLEKLNMQLAIFCSFC